MQRMSDIASRCKKNLIPYVICLACTAVLVVLDQISKAAAVRALPGAGTRTFIPYIFDLVYVENRGAAWGMLANSRWVFISVSVAAIILIGGALLYMARAKLPIVISLVLLLSGGIGNMIDRIANGYVVDFIQFAFWRSFPVFNVADSYVTVGGALLLVYVLFIDKTLQTTEKTIKSQ